MDLSRGGKREYVELFSCEIERVLRLQHRGEGSALLQSLLKRGRNLTLYQKRRLLQPGRKGKVPNVVSLSSSGETDDYYIYMRGQRKRILKKRKERGLQGAAIWGVSLGGQDAREEGNERVF